MGKKRIHNEDVRLKQRTYTHKQTAHSSCTGIFTAHPLQCRSMKAPFVRRHELHALFLLCNCRANKHLPTAILPLNLLHKESNFFCIYTILLPLQNQTEKGRKQKPTKKKPTRKPKNMSMNKKKQKKKRQIIARATSSFAMMHQWFGRYVFSRAVCILVLCKHT